MREKRGKNGVRQLRFAKSPRAKKTRKRIPGEKKDMKDSIGRSPTRSRIELREPDCPENVIIAERI